MWKYCNTVLRGSLFLPLVSTFLNSTDDSSELQTVPFRPLVNVLTSLESTGKYMFLSLQLPYIINTSQDNYDNVKLGFQANIRKVVAEIKYVHLEWVRTCQNGAIL